MSKGFTIWPLFSTAATSNLKVQFCLPYSHGIVPQSLISPTDFNRTTNGVRYYSMCDVAKGQHLAGGRTRLMVLVAFAGWILGLDVV